MHRIWTGLVRIQFNIIYIMRTKDVVAKLRCPTRGLLGCFPGLLCCDPKMLSVLHRTKKSPSRKAQVRLQKQVRAINPVLADPSLFVASSKR
jgi:hypothetical protein